jgi:hypothetical protein
MKKVYICSPLGGDVHANLERAKEYAKYALKCGAAPVVPHFYALLLDDAESEQRRLGMKAGQALLWFCDEVWVFTETRSPGMKDELALARQLGIKVRTFRAKQKLLGGIAFYETKKSL